MDFDSPGPSGLTDAQRNYLRRGRDAGIEPGSAHERAMRARIRERYKTMLYDLYLLSSYLEDRDRKRALADIDDSVALIYMNWVESILTLLFAGLLDSETETGEWDTPEELFTDIVGRAIKYSFPRHCLSIENVNVEITIERGEEFEDLTSEEVTEQPLSILQQMSSGNKITHEEFSKIVQDRDDIIRVRDDSESGVVSRLVQLDVDETDEE